MSEEPVIAVQEAVARTAHIDRAKYDDMYARSIADPAGFWGEHGKRLDWLRPYTKVKDVSFAEPDLHIRWYEEGTLTASANSLHRPRDTRGHQTALLMAGHDPHASKDNHLHTRKSR